MNRHLANNVIILALLITTIWACGKKAPPFLPQPAFLLSVRDLESQTDDGAIYIKGTVYPEGEEKAFSRIMGCRVDVAEFPLKSPPCAGCPISYTRSYEFGPEVLTPDGFRCHIPVTKKDQILFFKIHLMGPNRILGPASEPIRVDVE